MGCLLLSGADGGDAGSDKRNNNNNNNKAQASEALDCTKEKGGLRSAIIHPAPDCKHVGRH